jgi:hypothetical protein
VSAYEVGDGAGGGGGENGTFEVGSASGASAKGSFAAVWDGATAATRVEEDTGSSLSVAVAPVDEGEVTRCDRPLLK